MNETQIINLIDKFNKKCRINSNSNKEIIECVVKLSNNFTKIIERKEIKKFDFLDWGKMVLEIGSQENFLIIQ